MHNAEKDALEMAERREKMLAAGFKLFSERGIDAVKMQEVAAESGIGIATIYRYYDNKLSFVLDIGTRKWEEYGAYAANKREERRADEMTAAEELAFYLDFYIDLYQNHSGILRFNQDFNNFVRHEGVTQEQLLPYLRAVSVFAGMFHCVYEKGRRDGTIRTDLPEEKMFASTSHIMLAVAVRYAQGLIYSADVEADRTEEMQMLRRMILREFTAPGGG